MLFFISTITLGIVFSSINCNPSSNIYSNSYSNQYSYTNLFAHPVAQENERYCALKCKENFRYCMIENHAEQGVEFYRNCAQQVKLYHTLHELDQFICKTSSKKEYLQFLSCFVPAMSTLYKDNPKVMVSAESCLKKEENREKGKHFSHQPAVQHSTHPQHNLHQQQHQSDIVFQHLLS